MAKIRILAEDDVPAVAALFARVYPEHRWASQNACESYFKQMLFDHPWRDLELPSWVAEQDGRISGCYAVIPRPMLFRGRPIRVAVGFQFMVDPDQRQNLTPLQLAKACLSGPQDLTLADGASDQVRRGWTGIGGAAPLFYSLHWTRPLRPARYLLSLLEERAALPPLLTLAARPLTVLTDALVARLRPNRFYREAVELVEDTLDPAAMLAHLPDVVRGYALQPVYDARSLAWLLEQAGRKIRHGELRARAVYDGKRRLIGWYLYYIRAGKSNEVVQLAALNGRYDRVLQLLLADAWRHGATAVRGRLEPRYIQEISARHSWLRTDGTWTLVHSRHSDIMNAFHEGNAFISRLEGEWWMRFLGEEEAAPDTHRAPPAPDLRCPMLTESRTQGFRATSSREATARERAV
jgi:GNAT acetyltransferase-like protein